jgi:Na+/H+ antiporter NhaB
MRMVTMALPYTITMGITGYFAVVYFICAKRLSRAARFAGSPDLPPAG